MESMQSPGVRPDVADEVDIPALIDSPMMTAFVGPRVETYRTKWHAMWDKTGDPQKIKAKLSWNWAAFLFGFAWLYYRKMWAEALTDTLMVPLGYGGPLPDHM